MKQNLVLQVGWPVFANISDSILNEFRDSIVNLTDEAIAFAIGFVDQLSNQEILERFQGFFPSHSFGEVRIKRRWSRTSIQFDERILAAIFDSHHIENLRSTNEINPTFVQAMKKALLEYVGLVNRTHRNPVGKENPFGMIKIYKLNCDPRDAMRRILIANYSCTLIGRLSEAVRLFQRKLDLSSLSSRPDITVEQYESCLGMADVPALVDVAGKAAIHVPTEQFRGEPNHKPIEVALEKEILRQIQPAIAKFQKLQSTREKLSGIYESRPGSLVSLNPDLMKSVLLPNKAVQGERSPLGERFLMKIGHEVFAKQFGLTFNSNFQIELGKTNGKQIHDFYQLLDKWIKRERLATTCLKEHGLEHILPPHIEESVLMQSNNLRDYSSDRNVRSVEQQIRSAISGDGNSMLLGYDWQRLDSNNFQIQLMLQKHYRPYLAAVSHNLARRHSYSFVKGYLWWLLSSSFSHFDVSEFDFGRPSEPEDVWLNRKRLRVELMQR